MEFESGDVRRKVEWLHVRIDIRMSKLFRCKTSQANFGSGRRSPKFVPQFYANLVEVTSGLVYKILEVNFLFDSAFASSHLRFGVLMAMYIRVKRNKTTYFIQCDPTETTLDIKQKLCPLIEQPVNDQRLSLVATNEMLDDAKTLADQKVENDAVVALSLRKGAGDNDFEDVYIANPDLTSFS